MLRRMRFLLVPGNVVRGLCSSGLFLFFASFPATVDEGIVIVILPAHPIYVFVSYVCFLSNRCC